MQPYKLCALLIITIFVVCCGKRPDRMQGDVLGNHHAELKDWYNQAIHAAESSTHADTIIRCSYRSIQLAAKLGIDSARAIVVNGMGYLERGALEIALDRFTKAAKLYGQNNNQIGLATTYANISKAYSLQNNQANTILYLKRAIDLFRYASDSLRLVAVQNNLGYEYYHFGLYDSAIHVLTEAKQIHKQLGDSLGLAYCIGNIGLAWSKLSDYPQAKENLLEAMETLGVINDEYAISEYLIEFASILQAEKKIDKALVYARKAYRLATDNNILNRQRDAAFRLSNLFRQQQVFDSAFYFQDIYYTLNDSIKNLESVQRMADLRTAYEVWQKQTEVDNLEKSKSFQFIIIATLLIVLVLTVFLVIVYYRNLQRMKRFTELLEKRREESERQRMELKQLNDIKDKFFSIISHDLRNPIGSLGGISLLIRESLETGSTDLLNLATDYIDQNVVSLTCLLENLLNWALSQQGQFPFHPVKADTRELVTVAVKMLSAVALSKNVNIHLELRENLYVFGDENYLLTILRNLLSNALKFSSPDGHVYLSTRETDNLQTEIVIRDEGVGIPAEKLEHIFKLNASKSTRGTDKEKGLGLGLHLVYEFTKQNNGQIYIESEEKKGTTCTLRFPVYKE